MYVQKFGLPKARISRWTQSMASLIADVDGELELNATDSGPSDAAAVVGAGPLCPGPRPR